MRVSINGSFLGRPVEYTLRYYLGRVIGGFAFGEMKLDGSIWHIGECDILNEEDANELNVGLEGVSYRPMDLALSHFLGSFPEDSVVSLAARYGVSEDTVLAEIDKLAQACWGKVKDKLIYST